MFISREILKGHIDTIVLSTLEYEDTYGYQIVKTVRVKSDDQFELKEATLYLALKRLENYKWILSYWGDEQGQGGRRKYYHITDLGKEKLKLKRIEWEYAKELLGKFIERRDLDE